MPRDAERQDIRKAMAYDLCIILESKPEKETYTAEEVKTLIKNYTNTANQK